MQRASKYVKESITHVTLDPHVLTSPGFIFDANSILLAIPVTYYLSSNDYPDGIAGIDIDKSSLPSLLTRRYLACGVTMYNLTSNRVLWSHTFVRTSLSSHAQGLSTLTTQRKAWCHSTPVLVDIEGMGRVSTVFGTSQGLLFAVNEKGEVKPGFPVRFNSIHMAPVCADLVGDAYLEIVTTGMGSET